MKGVFQHYGIKMSKSLKTYELYKKYDGHCAYCGVMLKTDWQVDHIIPKSKGGTDDIGNLNPSCPRCNYTKKAMTDKEFKNHLKQRFETFFKTPMFELARDMKLIEKSYKPVKFYFELKGE